jgi:DNA-binding CsgD family transcriptional regulator
MAKRQGARLYVTKQHPHPPGEMSLLLELVNERAAGSTRRHGKLTLRENEVLRWIADGKSNQQIAEILGISLGTVRKHIERIFDKLGVDNRAAAASSYHSVPTEHR